MYLFHQIERARQSYIERAHVIMQRLAEHKEDERVMSDK